MSTVISFLESLGGSAELRQSDDDQLQAEMRDRQIDPLLQAAILSRDVPAIEAILGRHTTVCCAVFPGKEDDESEEEPSKDDDEVSSQAARAA